MSRVKTSEFGTGLCYNLGLFLAHSERYIRDKEMWTKIQTENPEIKLFQNVEERCAELFFNGAGDHLFGFLAKHAPLKLQKRCKTFRNKVLNWRTFLNGNSPREKDVLWAIQEAKNLLFLIDKTHNIPVRKAEWS